jgi:hypothetical protein
MHLGYGTYIWLSVSKLPLQCAVVWLYSVVKQRLKCNTGEVCNCLIQFLLTVVLSIDERVFISAQRLSERTVYQFISPFCRVKFWVYFQFFLGGIGAPLFSDVVFERNDNFGVGMRVPVNVCVSNVCASKRVCK